MKALIYCRVSSDRQVTDGHGLDGQESHSRKFATAKGHEVERVFRDEGISGGDFERPGMTELLNFLERERKKGRQYVVIVDDLKRLARDVVAHFHIRKQLTSLGATIESPVHMFDESPEGKFTETVLAAGAE